MVLWDILPKVFHSLEIILSTIGIALVVKTIWNVYNWIKGHAFEFRFSYLENLKNTDDMKIVWRSVWETKNINPRHEKQFFEKFTSNIEKLWKNGDKLRNLKTILIVLNDFSLFLKNRCTIFLVVWEEIFPKILEWHFRTWKKIEEYIDKDEKVLIWAEYDEALRTLDLMLQEIEKRVLRERQSYSFFRHLNRHSNNYCNMEYLEHLFANFYEIFFECITESPEHHDIWEHYFPVHWKITESNLRDKNNVISRISWKEFQLWARDRISNPKEDFDSSLQEVSYNLFPDVNPLMWSKILLFIFSTYDPTNRGRSIIERRWNFESSPRLRKDADPAVVDNLEIIKTFKLTDLLFKQEFAKDKVEKYVEDLKELRYEKNTLEEHQRWILLDFFNKMLKFLVDN